MSKTNRDEESWELFNFNYSAKIDANGEEIDLISGRQFG